MNVLIAHNKYQHRGGEDAVVDAEIALLRANGHNVETYFRSNVDVDGISRIALGRQTLWSERTASDVAQLVSRFRPDVIHVHNTFPLISPSLYWVADRARVPVVQTLHNFRLMCLNALFLRRGRVCEECLGQWPWRGIVHSCYRQSIVASGVLASSLILHRTLGTYRRRVSRYIALNEFCRRKFVAGGLPADRILVKPNFVDWGGAATDDFDANAQRERHFLFVGRLSAEKGVGVLAKAAGQCPGIRWRVVGDGPERRELEGIGAITRMGSMTIESVRQEMLKASALVVPSIWYENFPRAIVEAYACGLPVIASRIGALPELVRDGETGLLFESANSGALAEKISWAAANPAEMRRMGNAARREYERHYSPARNYEILLNIYISAIDDARRNDC